MGNTIKNLKELIENSSKKFPEITALSMGKKSITYKELNHLSNKIASYLQSHNITKDDKIGILSENSIEWVIVFFGILKTGATAVCMDSFLTNHEIEYIIKDAEINTIFTTTIFLEPLKKISKEYIKLKNIVDVNKTYDFLDSKLSHSNISPDDLAILIYTSGTTGTQKGVMLTHENIVSNTISASKRIQNSSGTSFLSLLPLSHMFGIVAGLLIPLYNGCIVAFSPSLKGPEILKTMKISKTNVMIVVPLMLQIFKNMITETIEQSPKLTKNIFDSLFKLSDFLNKFGINAGRLFFNKIHKTFGGHLKYFVSGGAPLDQEIEKYFCKLGFPILQGYGLTEASPIVSVNSLKERKFGSVGRLLENVNVNILDNGEIIVKGPNIMKGYYKNEKITSQVIKKSWFYTGDIGEIDSDGYLFIKGREKNVIVTNSGLKIFPEELENKLLQSKYIKEVCVVAKKTGNAEQPFAIIYPNYSLFKGLEEDKITEIINDEFSKCQEDVMPQQRVNTFTIWDTELPKTTTKKIKRSLILNILSTQGFKPIKNRDKEELDSFAKDICKIVSKTTKISENQIFLGSNFVSDLGIDSLMKIEILSSIEKELNVYIPDDQSYKIETFQDLVNTVKTYLSTPYAEKREDLFSDIHGDTSNIIKSGFLYRITRFITTLILIIFNKLYFRISAKGKENIPKDGSMIIASNHGSVLDFILIYTVLPLNISIKTAAPAAKDFFFNNPVSSFLIQAAFNAFPLDRYGNFFEGLKVAANIIKSGNPLILFPEGTRSKDGKMLVFKPGIGMLTLELNVPILPVYIENSHKALGKGAKIPRPCKVTLKFGKPLYPDKYKKNTNELSNYEIYQKIIDDLKKEIIELRGEI